LIEKLDSIYKPLDYDPDLSVEEFVRASAYRAGQISVVEKLKLILKQQMKER
jgi:hypothetical protein